MTPRQLAAAIRKGHTMIKETRKQYLSQDRSCGCAIGAAVMATGLADEFVIFADISPETHAASILGIPENLAKEISGKHYMGETRLAIADWLDTLEPETNPAHKQSFEDFKAAMLAPVDLTLSTGRLQIHN